MSKTSLEKAALAVSVFACATMLSFDWTEQKGASLSIERAQAQTATPTPRALPGGRRGGPRPVPPQWAPVPSQPERPPPTTRRRPLRLLRRRRGGAYGYYGPDAWSQDYAARNGIICQPGTMVRLEDGLMHRCQ